MTMGPIFPPDWWPGYPDTCPPETPPAVTATVRAAVPYTATQAVPVYGCRNPEHSDHLVAVGPACRPPVRRSIPHRAVGAAATGVVLSLCGAVWLGWQIGDRLSRDARIARLIAARAGADQ